jgi:hypothetical protein
MSVGNDLGRIATAASAGFGEILTRDENNAF